MQHLPLLFYLNRLNFGNIFSARCWGPRYAYFRHSVVTSSVNSNSNRKPDLKSLYVSRLETTPFFQVHFRSLWHMKHLLGDEFTDSKFLLGLYKAGDKETFGKEMVVGRGLPYEHAELAPKIINTAWEVLEQTCKEYQEKYSSETSEARKLAENQARLDNLESKLGTLETQNTTQASKLIFLGDELKQQDAAVAQLKQQLETSQQEWTTQMEKQKEETSKGHQANGVTPEDLRNVSLSLPLRMPRSSGSRSGRRCSRSSQSSLKTSRRRCSKPMRARVRPPDSGALQSSCCLFWQRVPCGTGSVSITTTTTNPTTATLTRPTEKQRLRFIALALGGRTKRHCGISASPITLKECCLFKKRLSPSSLELH